MIHTDIAFAGSNFPAFMRACWICRRRSGLSGHGKSGQWCFSQTSINARIWASTEALPYSDSIVRGRFVDMMKSGGRERLTFSKEFVCNQ